jgi:hypothetical protein
LNKGVLGFLPGPQPPDATPVWAGATPARYTHSQDG